MDALTRDRARALLRLATRADTLALAVGRARRDVAVLEPVVAGGRRVRGSSDPSAAAASLADAITALERAADCVRDARSALLHNAERPHLVAPGLYELRGRLTVEPDLL